MNANRLLWLLPVVVIGVILSSLAYGPHQGLAAQGEAGRPASVTLLGTPPATRAFAPSYPPYPWPTASATPTATAEPKRLFLPLVMRLASETGRR